MTETFQKRPATRNVSHANAADSAYLAYLFSALANEKRVEMLYVLYRETTVGELAHQIGLSQSATSQHLAKLSQASIVAMRRHKQQRYYLLVSDPVKKLLEQFSVQ